MKRILLLSDTHSYIDDQILKHVQWADEVWHAGDIGDIAVADTISNLRPLRAVYGNIDDTCVRLSYPLDNIFEVEGVAVCMTHIGGYPNKYKPRVEKLIALHNPKLFICGHSHILKVQYDKRYQLLHLNPGAAGKHGFHKVRTILRFELEKGAISNMEIVELAKRK